MKRPDRLPLAHPWLFALHRVLTTCALSEADPTPGEVTLTFAGALALTTVLYFILRAATGAARRAALAATAVLLLFFDLSPLGTGLARLMGIPLSSALSLRAVPAVPLVPFLALTAIVILLLRRSSSDLRAPNRFALLATILLLGVSIAQFTVARSNLANADWKPVVREMTEPATGESIHPGVGLPDIYVIVLDGYARTDVLRDLYAYDNAEWIAFLRSRDFFIADRAQAAYIQTLLSLTSTLNLTNLDGLAAVMGAASRDRAPLRHAIETNRLAGLLKGAGYRYIVVDSSYPGTRRSSLADEERCLNVGPSALQRELLWGTAIEGVLSSRDYTKHRALISCALEAIKKPRAAATAPTLLFAHLLVPHPPFVYDERGAATKALRLYDLADGQHFLGDDSEYVSGYAAQIAYTEQAMRTVIETILDRDASAQIFLFSDHGPGSQLSWEEAGKSNLRERSAILAAYHLPQVPMGELSPTTGPAEATALSLKYLLGVPIPALSLESHYSAWTSPYRFEVIGEH